MNAFYEEQLLNTQFGFRSGVGCNDGILVIKQLQEITYRSNEKLYTCYIDLTTAFDHVNRSFLFKSIGKRLPKNHQTTNIDILERLYEQTSSYLENKDPKKDCFSTSSGVREGVMRVPIFTWTMP